MKKYFLKVFVPVFFSAILLFNPAAASPSRLMPAIDAEEMIRDIIAVVGLKPNFDVKAANIPNAAAITYQGKRYIAYNPTFIAGLNTKAGNKWASVSILAHEIGHHLNGHTLLNHGSKPDLELEADEFSGFVLQKMGATMAQAQVAMKLASDYKPGLTHPGRSERLAAIAKGWNKASFSANDMAKYNKPSAAESPGRAYRQPNTTGRLSMPNESTARNGARGEVPARQPLLANRHILAHVNFPSDRTGNYYVTTQFNLVKVVNSQLVVLGKMLATNNAEYPFVMKNQEGTLLVDRNGRILTPDRQLAGYLTKA